MSYKEAVRLAGEGIRARENYVGKKSGNKITVVSADQFSVKYHYVYANGKRMTADQEVTRTDFDKKFCRASQRVQEA